RPAHLDARARDARAPAARRDPRLAVGSDGRRRRGARVKRGVLRVLDAVVRTHPARAGARRLARRAARRMKVLIVSGIWPPDVELRHAAHVCCPSSYLRDLAVAWGVAPGRVSVLPNPAPALPDLPARDELQQRFGLNGATIAFAGRLTAQKSLGRALEAVASADGVQLVIAGEGPDRAPLESRVHELGLDERV